MGQSMKMQVKAYATDDSDGLMLWELAQLNVQSGVAQRSSSGESGLIPVALWRPVQPRPNSRCRLILAHPERPFGGLDLVADAPARDKRTGERCVGEVDRNRVVEHTASSRWRHRPPVRAAVLVEPGGYSSVLSAETSRRDGDADADWEAPFGPVISARGLS